MNEYTLFVDVFEGLGQDAPAAVEDTAGASLLIFLRRPGDADL